MRSGDRSIVVRCRAHRPSLPIVPLAVLCGALGLAAASAARATPGEPASAETRPPLQRVARLDPRVRLPVRPPPTSVAPVTAAEAAPCRLAWGGDGSHLACGESADGRLFVTPRPLAPDDPLLQLAAADADVAMALRSLHRVDGDLFEMDGGELAVRSVGTARAMELLREPDAARRSSPVMAGEARFRVDVAWADAGRSVATIRLRPHAGNPRRDSAGALVEYAREADGRYRLRHWRLL